MTPREDESLLGYIKRRSEAEGFPNAGGYLTMLGQAYGRAAFEKAGDLATALDLELSALEPLLPGNRPDDPALSWSFHRMHRDPVCPKCSAERGPRRKEWRHHLVAACAQHGCQLIDQCPGCEAPLTLTGDGYVGCLCGVEYGAAEIAAATPLEVEAARLVAGRPSRLAGVDLEPEDAHDAVRTLWFLSSYLDRTRTGKEGKATRPRTLEETRAFLARVELILMNWPHAFDDHVHQRWEAPGAEGLTAAARLGSWYRGLLQQKGRLSEALLSRCIDVVGSVCGDTYKTSRHGGPSGWVSATEAGRLLGIRAERIVEAARGGFLAARQGRSGTGHRHTIVRTQDVDVIRTLREGAATKERVRTVLGLSRKQFDLLEEASFFGEQCRATQHPCVDGTYSLEKIRQTTGQILNHIPQERESAERTISFREINLRRTTDRKALLQIYGLIATQKIRPASSKEGGRLGDAQFDADVIDRHLQQQGGARSWTASEVAILTGWKPECITGWCEQGLIQAKKGKRGALSVWQISEKALADFQREFQVVSDIAKEGKTTSRKILASLELHRITSVGSQPSGTSSRGHLIRTNDLSRILTASRI